MVWQIESSHFIVCSFILFLGLVCAGTNASVSGNCRLLNLKMGYWCCVFRVIVAILQYNVVILMRKRGYDMSPGFPAYSCLETVTCVAVRRCGTRMVSSLGWWAVLRQVPSWARNVKTMAQCWEIVRFLRYLWSSWRWGNVPVRGESTSSPIPGDSTSSWSRRISAEGSLESR